MGNSRLLGLADSLAAALNAAQPVPPATEPVSPFTVAFTATRKLLPVWKLEQIGTALAVYLVGLGYTEDSEKRLTGPFNGDYDILLCVQQRLVDGNGIQLKGTALESAGDALATLATALTDFFKYKRFAVTGTQGANLRLVDANPLYHLEILQSMGVFDSAQVLTFRNFA